MKIEASKKDKAPIINKSLDKSANKILFPKKLEAANSTLRKAGVPQLKSKKR